MLGDSIVRGEARRWVWPSSAGDAVEAKAHVTAREAPFMKTRRMFLGGMLFAGDETSLSAALPIAQPQEFPRKPQPIELPPPDFPTPEKRTPEENNKDTRKKVERLYQLAAEMKVELDKTDSMNVLSVNLLKKAEEIGRRPAEHRSAGKEKSPRAS